MAHARAQLLGDRDHLVGRPQRAGSDEDRDLLPAFSTSAARRRSASNGVPRASRSPRPNAKFRARAAAPVWLFLQIVRQHDCRDPPLAQRDANGAVDQMPHLRRRRRLLHERAGDILEHADEIDFLLIMAAERVARLLADDRQHRHVIQPRIVKPGDQVRGARA